MKLKIQYNAPVILTFSALSLLALVMGYLTGGVTNTLLFSVYRASLLDPLTYLRLFAHVLGHGSISHYANNILLLLVVGPPMEEKYGGRALVFAFAVTALISGAVQMLLFPGCALLGASGIVFMLIVLSSLSGMKEGRIPLTLILVLVFYLGREAVTVFTQQDSVSQLTHIIGGLCGAVIGFSLNRK